MASRIAAGVLLAFATACVVAAPQAEPIRIDRYADLIAFTPTEPASALSLRVVGPEGFVQQRFFAPNDTAYLDVVGPGGEMLSDGVYRYEVRVLRDPAVARASDGARGRQPSHVGGSFRVEGGSIVDPGSREGELK